MNIREIEPINQQLDLLSKSIQDPEFYKFDTSEIYSFLSEETLQFLSPIEDKLKLFLNCSKRIPRWQDHFYSKLTRSLNDNDYDHILGMFEIDDEIKKLGLKSINFSHIDLMVLFHDASEIVTGDVSLIHPPEMNDLCQTIKEIEPRVFPLILRQIDLKFSCHRRTFYNLYHRYQSRQKSPQDSESHLVKLIDLLQGDRFGLQYVYSKTKLYQFYGDNLPVSPDDFVERSINSEISQLKIVLNSIEKPEDKSKLFLWFRDQQFVDFSNPEYGFQDLFKRYSPKLEELNPFPKNK